MADLERLPDGRWRCRLSVFGHGRCELDEKHHGPCTSGRAQVFHRPAPCGADKGCAECDRIDAVELLRLDAGGELRPLQKRPPWTDCPSLRASMVQWARETLAYAEKHGG